jgi:fatty-acyl-CoA synthase
MIRAFDRHNLKVLHGWGMTETTPAASVNYLKRDVLGLSADEQYALRAKQGVPLPFVEVRSMAGESEVPWDGKTMGELQVRGPWIAAGYHDLEAESDKWSEDGWFRTGDVVTIDARGYIKITDRIKDLVKSGGEWISSLDLENALVGHAKVAEAAVIAVPDAKWGERPLAVVVLKSGQSATQDELNGHLAPNFAKFCLPDAYAFVSEIPKSSTGKMQKAQLRERFKDHKTGG